jgi:hypothetical protein
LNVFLFGIRDVLQLVDKVARAERYGRKKGDAEKRNTEKKITYPVVNFHLFLQNTYGEVAAASVATTS